MSTERRAYASMAAAMVIVGSSVVAGKVLTTTMPVFLGSALRFLIASALLVPLYLAVALRRGEPVWPGGRRVGILFLQALTGIFGFNVALLYGLKYTSASAGGIITSLTPVAVVALAGAFLHERIRARRLAGLALAVAGLAVLNVHGTGQGSGGAGPPGGHALLGNLLVLGAVVGEALFTVLGKAVSSSVSPLGITTYVSAFGLAMFALPGAWELSRFPLAGLTVQGWGLLAYYGIVVTVVSFLLWYDGLAHVEAGSAGVLTAIIPVSAVALAWLVLGERPSPVQLLAGLLVVAAVWLTSTEHREDRLARAQAAAGPGR